MDKARLEYEMKKQGMTTAKLCEILGMAQSTFYRKCVGKSEFTLSEIQKIGEVLKLESLTPIFFVN